MKSKHLLLGVWLMLIGFTLPIFAASTPTANDGKWYYVKSQRYGSGGPWWTFTGDSKVVPGALTKTDAQKFTLVTTVEGKITVQEFDGNKLTAAAGVFDVTGAATGWTITPNTVNGIVGFAFPGENEGLHQGAKSWDWEMRAGGWYDITDFCTFFFYEVGADLDLALAVDDAISLKSTTLIGTTLGKTPQAAHDDFQAAIDAAKLTLGSTDETAIANAINVLSGAQATFVAAKIPVVDSSTAGAPVWYLIKNTIRGGKGATTYTNGWNAQLLCTTAANTVKADGTSTGAAAPALKHLFRFEKQANGHYQIVNAALPDGEVLQTAAGGYSSEAVNYGTKTSPVTTWEINAIGFNATLEVEEITFVSSGVGTVWHDAGDNTVVSYPGGTGGASAWYVEKYTGSVEALFQPQYDALVAEYNLIADASGNVMAPYVLGTSAGQYNASKFDAVKVAYAAMVAEKEANGVASSNMLAKFAGLNADISAFKASKVMPVAYGGTIDPSKSYTLKLVQAGSANDGYFLSNPNTDTTPSGNRLYAQFSQNIDAANSVWKFVASTTAGKYIIVSTRGTNEYLDEEGRVRKDGYGDNGWTTKTLLQNTALYDAETTLLIVKIDQNSNFYNVGTGSEAKLGRNASNWATFKLQVHLGTPVNETAISDISLKVVNRMLVVSGTSAQAQAYSITGSQVDTSKQLNPGIYIVKVDNQTFKVNVR